MMNLVVYAALVAALACACAGDGWRWPEGAASVRIDTKVRFIDDAPPKDHKDSHNEQQVQADEPQFVEATNTEGFYNRPPGQGRYPVRVEAPRAPYKLDDRAIYATGKAPPLYAYSDGTLDSLQYCKCVSTPECNPSIDSAKACGQGKYLCCYKRPNKQSQKNSEFFNEVEDERPVLLPSQGGRAGPFPPPPDTALNGVFGPGHGHEAALLGTLQQPQQLAFLEPGPHGKPVLAGPDGPTGIIGPGPNRGVLVGPEGPTGVVGPQPNRGVLSGPEGPTGIIGPQSNRGVLSGPDGPTGIIGPSPFNKQDFYNQDSSETAQRGVLVGPGGPTGIIGPAGRGYGRRPVLVGPGGPTGIIGPYGRQQPGLLVGPGGPTGMIGPPRRRPYYYGK